MRNSKVLIFLSIIFLSIAFTGCNVFSDDDSEGNQDLVLSGYYWLAGDEESVADDASGRASINISDLTDGIGDSDSYPFATLKTNSAKENMVSNYPEKGMKTYYTVTDKDTVSSYTDKDGVVQSGTEYNIYKISAETIFKNKDRIFDHYQEDYYILDLDGTNTGNPEGDGYWTNVDIIVKSDGSDWAQDNTARETMELHYDDSSVRYEWIVSDSSITGEYYEQFDYDNGSMTIPDDEDWEPTAETDPVGEEMSWSSEVHYYQQVSSWVDWWYVENKEIYGVRYYTESGNATDGYVKSTLSYERIISKTELESGDTSYISEILKWLFGDPDSAAEASDSGMTLSETVIRDQITTKNGKKETKTSTTVVPTFGDSFNITDYSSYDL